MAPYTIRPSNSEKEAFRIKLTAASLVSLKLRPGDLCTLHLANEDHQNHRVAIAWENSGAGMKDTIVQVSKTLQMLYNVKLQDRVEIERSHEKLQDAEIVLLKAVGEKVITNDQTKWSLAASMTIPAKHDVLAPGQQVVVEVGPHKNEFEVVSVGHAIARVTSQTVFKFDGNDAPIGQQKELQLDFSRMGGIQTQIRRLRGVVKNLKSPPGKSHWGEYRQTQGILLYGAKGTGKRMLQDAMADNNWSKVVRWSPGTKVTAGADSQLILIDFEELTSDRKVISELMTLFKSIKDSYTLVLGSVGHPNDVSSRLRSRQTFSLELEMPIPDAEQRLDILRSLRGASVEPNDEQLQDIASRTHGFVGADLDRFLHATVDATVEREQSLPSEPNGSSDNASELGPVQSSDIEVAFSQIRPSALQEIFLEKPNVRWSDIGGQHDIKRQLQNAVERPLEYPERMKLLGLQPKKGVLLYGPPGCSKTLTVKALATEAGLNFLAVKGAELVSMYVGESEKATREVFRKARQASPAIIFFDEIDAIARRGRSGSDLNVLTTLLNEMDGFEELKNVMVVAATNKPQEIDPALLRPGRFDNVVYIGPPDQATRKEIFDKRFAGISVDAAVVSSTDRFAGMTEGYSGAEVVAICQGAGESAFDNDRDFITEGDVIAAITSTPKGISKEMLDEYHAWNAARNR